MGRSSKLHFRAFGGRLQLLAVEHIQQQDGTRIDGVHHVQDPRPSLRMDFKKGGEVADLDGGP